MELHPHVVSEINQSVYCDAMHKSWRVFPAQRTEPGVKFGFVADAALADPFTCGLGGGHTGHIPAITSGGRLSSENRLVVHSEACEPRILGTIAPLSQPNSSVLQEHSQSPRMLSRSTH